MTGQGHRAVLIDGIRTHYLDLGDGPSLVLLHDGAFGASAELCWFRNLEFLARRYRVIAPDWLGFGDTDKLHDFGGGRARRLWHMTRFLETLAVEEAAFIGNSMGATLLLQVAASKEQPWPIRALVSASGGGFIPFNEARRQSMEFDCTYDGMRRVLGTMVHEERWLDEDDLAERRFRSATRPGAWEAVAAARFRSPASPARSEFGNEDVTNYERIGVPTLLIAGACDKLRLPGYIEGLAARIPQAEVHSLEGCGHLPQIERAGEFNQLTMDFLARRYVS